MFGDQQPINRPFFATCWPGPSAESCRGFFLHKFWRILPGIFLEEMKIREKSVLPKSNPKTCFRASRYDYETTHLNIMHAM